MVQLGSIWGNISSIHYLQMGTEKVVGTDLEELERNTKVIGNIGLVTETGTYIPLPSLSM